MNDKSEMQPGISLRQVHIATIVLAVIISSILIIATFSAYNSFVDLSESTNDYIIVQNAAKSLMDASDDLTENAQRFTVRGDRVFMDAYFDEADNVKRREAAIDTMSSYPGTERALVYLQEAMSESVALMDREYYAMRLVVDAKGITYHPEVLDQVELSAADSALSASEKMSLAQRMVMDREYYNYKDNIKHNIQQSLDILTERIQHNQVEANESMKAKLNYVRIIIIIQIILIFSQLFITSKLGIKPIMMAVEEIKNDSPIPEVGAAEFKYLARTYNKMYAVYKKSIENLNYKASHDELTGAYNRAGYDLLMESLDLESTTMLLIDADNFKTINDSFGHEMGDRILVKIVNTMKSHFRTDDYICRIGGDEFVIFVQHVAGEADKTIGEKINEINKVLMQPSDGLPKTSVSVGIAHGKDAGDSRKLYIQADKALYQAKQNGRCGYSVYKA